MYRDAGEIVGSRVLSCENAIPPGGQRFQPIEVRQTTRTVALEVDDDV